MYKPSVFIRIAAAFASLIAVASISASEVVRKYAIELTATVQRSPAQIELKWRPLPDSTGYSVARKSKESSTWTTLNGSLPASAASFTDTAVVPGVGYEYRVLKNPVPTHGGSGFIYAGIDLPLVENRGKLLLIVDSTYAPQLSAELARLEQDLAGDGWTVLRHDVARGATPPEVKNLIKADYQADPQNVKVAFLFGHVPVPYSGNIVPDGHSEHQGAWPADAYYGDMDGNWSDHSVNNGGAQRPQNKNVPGDGKFDQSTFPSDIELQVGRVDLANLPGFAPKTELDLLRQYLDKDHNFRHARLNVPRRALINDNFGEMYGEAFGSSGYRNFSTFFGSENIDQIEGWLYFSTLKEKAYLWSYACGGGSYNYCHYVGGTGDYNATDVKTVFTFLLGSYFGDWDAENSFLRAPLGSATHGLTSAWAGRPHWFAHHMALGETIGYGAKMTMNNQPYHPRHYERSVHIALMGDPTLRLHPVLPVSNVSASKLGSEVRVTWSPSSDTAIKGYHVYKAASVSGPFTRVNSSLVQGTSFSDTSSAGNVYMVRAVKLEQSASGTYFNASQGAFATVKAGVSGGPIPLSIARSGTDVSISFPSEIGQIYAVETSDNLVKWTLLENVTAVAAATTSTQNKSETKRFYRVRRLL